MPRGLVVHNAGLWLHDGSLLASGGSLQRTHDLPDATINVFEGLAFLSILASEALRGRMGEWLARVEAAKAQKAEHETSRARLAREQAAMDAARQEAA